MNPIGLICGWVVDKAITQKINYLVYREPYFLLKCGIDSLVIYGDSKIIIEWEKGNFNLQVNLLQSLCKRMISLITYFNQLYFMHIRRSYNKKVDGLSKTTVKEVFGNLFFHAFQEGNIFLEGSELLD